MAQSKRRRKSGKKVLSTSFEEYLDPSSRSFARINAITHSEDRDLLAEILEHELGGKGISVSLKQTLVRRVGNPELLKKHLFTDVYGCDFPKIAYFVVTKTILTVLQDQSCFKDAFEKKLHPTITVYCLSKIEDRSYVLNVLKTSGDSEEIVTSLKNLGDWDSKKWAFNNLVNNKIVQKYIKNSLNWSSNTESYVMCL